jgi:hypothetical protein
MIERAASDLSRFTSTLPPLGENGDPREARFADGANGGGGKTPIGDALLRNDAPFSPRGGRVVSTERSA